MKKTRTYMRKIRHKRIRKKIIGTPERPRLSVFISNRHVYAQLIDDENGITLAAASTLEKPLRDKVGSTPLKELAAEVGELLAKRALEKNKTAVVFDRGGFRYHGRVKALADAARQAGLKF